MSIERLNPDTLHKNPAFTQVVTVSKPSKTVYVGGQNGVNAKGEIVGDDIASQSVQAYKNVVAALEAAGATMRDVFKMTIYLAQGQSAEKGYAALSEVQDKSAPPPIVTVVLTAGFANPKFLVEIEAFAAID